MASFLIDAAKRGIDSLDPGSPHIEELKKIDADNIIREDINKICETVSIAEIAKIFSLSARLQTVSKEKRGVIKDELKRIAQDAAVRAESKFGRLKTPERYRRLLWEV
ncbi:MAG: hypothetical protein V3S04_00870 [Candidatus Omnitrophota bacterium]